LEDCGFESVGSQFGDGLVVGVARHAQKRRATRVAHDEDRIPLVSLGGDEDCRALAGIENGGADLLEKREHFAAVALIRGTALVAGEAQEVEHDHRPTFVFVAEAPDGLAGRVNGHVARLLSRRSGGG
jgi:hypothetical protein